MTSTLRPPAKVLVVDDESTFRSTIAEHLLRVGYQVIEVDSGLDAIRTAQAENPDLILLDLKMPDMNGFEVCKELRASSQTREIPILLLTGFAGSETESEGLAAGADDFLTKPVFTAELLARVRNLLKIRFLKEQLGAVQKSIEQVVSAEDLGEAGNQIRSLLIVPDDRREEFCDLLGSDGYRVAFCKPYEALEVAQAFSPHIIIVGPFQKLDETMELFREFRRLASLRTAHILLLSDSLDSLGRVAAFEAGIDECLSLPFHPLELLSRLRVFTRRQEHQWRLEQQFRSASQRAILDGLTGAHNRAFFDQHLHYQCKLATRYRKLLSIILLDLDHFKTFNDRFGHTTGDEVLRKVVELIRVSIRASDVLCRFGGEEFAVLLTNTSKTDARVVAERIRLTIANTAHWSFIPTKVTASLGSAIFGEDATSWRELLDAADEALYRAKEMGRNCSVQYDASWKKTDAGKDRSDLRGAPEKS